MTKTENCFQETAKSGPSAKQKRERIVILNQMIGYGASGKVYKTNNSQIVAKVIPIEKSESANREIYFNRQLRGASICNLIKAQKNAKYVILYFQNGGQNLKKCNLNVFDKPIVLKKIVEAYKIFYKNGIAHRDLKPENIVMDNNKKVRIIDLGLCQKAKQRYGTQGYMPQEQQKRDFSNNDMFAYGKIIIDIMGKDINEELTQLMRKCVSPLTSRCSWDHIFEFWDAYKFENLNQ